MNAFVLLPIWYRLVGVTRAPPPYAVVPLVTVIVLRVLAGLVQPPAPIRKVATRPSVTDTAIGVAALSPVDTPQSLIERADVCLYAAKRAGRNRVISQSDPEATQADPKVA